MANCLQLLSSSLHTVHTKASMLVGPSRYLPFGRCATCCEVSAVRVNLQPDVAKIFSPFMPVPLPVPVTDMTSFLVHKLCGGLQAMRRPPPL